MWSVWLGAPFGGRVDVPIRPLSGYSFAGSDDAILMAVVVLVCDLLCSSGHEAAGNSGSFPGQVGPWCVAYHQAV